MICRQHNMKTYQGICNGCLDAAYEYAERMAEANKKDLIRVIKEREAAGLPKFTDERFWPENINKL